VLKRGEGGGGSVKRGECEEGGGGYSVEGQVWQG
jgi:hypothetical protein